MRTVGTRRPRKTATGPCRSNQAIADSASSRDMRQPDAVAVDEAQEPLAAPGAGEAVPEERAQRSSRACATIRRAMRLKLALRRLEARERDDELGGDRREDVLERPSGAPTSQRPPCSIQPVMKSNIRRAVL